jgi:hypothetical protein
MDRLTTGNALLRLRVVVVHVVVHSRDCFERWRRLAVGVMGNSQESLKPADLEASGPARRNCWLALIFGSCGGFKSRSDLTTPWEQSGRQRRVCSSREYGASRRRCKAQNGIRSSDRRLLRDAAPPPRPRGDGGGREDAMDCPHASTTQSRRTAVSHHC